MRKFLLLILFTTTLFQAARTQDPLFSLYRNAPLYLNPALAGVEENLAFHSTYRSQWRNLGLPYTTSHFSITQPIYRTGKKNKGEHLGGVGLSFLNDVAGENGIYKSVGVSATFAYNIILSKDGYHNLNFGLQTGFRQRRINLGNFKWGEQYNRYIGYDENIQPTDELLASKINLDISSGLYYRYLPNPKTVHLINKGFLGISASHLNYPNQSLIINSTYRTPPLFKLNGGLEWKITEQIFAETQTLLMFQNAAKQYNVGSNFSYYLFNKDKNFLQNSFFSFGTWYRVKDSFIFSLELGSNFYKLGFAYDLNTSALGRYYKGTGAYEVTLQMILYKERKKFGKFR